MHVNVGCMLSLGFVDYVVIHNYGKFKISVTIPKQITLPCSLILLYQFCALQGFSALGQYSDGRWQEMHLPSVCTNCSCYRARLSEHILGQVGG